MGKIKSSLAAIGQNWSMTQKVYKFLWAEVLGIVLATIIVIAVPVSIAVPVAVIFRPACPTSDFFPAVDFSASTSTAGDVAHKR